VGPITKVGDKKQHKNALSHTDLGTKSGNNGGTGGNVNKILQGGKKGHWVEQKCEERKTEKRVVEVQKTYNGTGVGRIYILEGKG